MTETRAERRRKAREKKWEPHNQEKHQSIGTIQEQLERHTAMCLRCRTGVVADRGCEWLDQFYTRYQHQLRSILGIPEEKPDLFEEYLYRKRTTASESTEVRHIEVE